MRAQLPGSRPVPSAPARTRVRLLVVDDHEAIRIGIARLLSDAEPSIEVVGQAGSGREALARWRTLRPDVVLMDLRMPDGDGVEAIVRIRGEDAEAAIVALTAFDHDELVAGALRAGARGYLGKDASGAELARAVPAAAHGGALLSGRGGGVAARALQRRPRALGAGAAGAEPARARAARPSDRRRPVDLGEDGREARGRDPPQDAVHSRTQVALQAREHALR